MLGISFFMMRVCILYITLLIMSDYCVGQNSADVIVIGAGVAGLKAAYDLQKTHKRSVIVLEARDRPYGRIDTVQPSGWPIKIEVCQQRCLTGM